MFGEDPPKTFTGYIPAVPMVALAVAKFGRCLYRRRLQHAFM
jgi:hypothetical protein